MDKDKAIDVLVQIAMLAQKGGLLTLEEAVIVFDAVKAVKPLPSPEEVAPSNDKKTKK